MKIDQQIVDQRIAEFQSALREQKVTPQIMGDFFWCYRDGLIMTAHRKDEPHDKTILVGKLQDILISDNVLKILFKERFEKRFVSRNGFCNGKVELFAGEWPLEYELSRLNSFHVGMYAMLPRQIMLFRYPGDSSYSEDSITLIPPDDEEFEKLKNLMENNMKGRWYR